MLELRNWAPPGRFINMILELKGRPMSDALAGNLQGDPSMFPVAPLLRVDDLRTRFMMRDVVVYAVNGISYEIAHGETLGIVGESGCGKSVSVMSLMRLLPQPPARIEADAIRFGDVDLLHLPLKEMCNIRGKDMAMIFQDPMTSLNPVLTIGRQLEEPLEEHLGYSRQEAREKAIELLDIVGIAEPGARVRQYPHQLSGGMRQRVMIAMAVSCHPKLLIADEPTTALDVTIQAQILDILRGLREQYGMALILITHSLGVVAGVCDRVAVMYAGYIVEQAETTELFARPRHPYTTALLHCVPQIDRDVDADLPCIDGLPPDLSLLPEGCPFAARCHGQSERCLKENPPLVEVAPGHSVRCWDPPFSY